MGKYPISPGVRPKMLLTRGIASGGTYTPPPPLPVEKRAGPCPAWRARVATSPPSAVVSLIPAPAPPSNLLFDAPIAPSDPISSKESQRTLQSARGNSHEPASARETGRQDHGSYQRSLPRCGTITATVFVGCDAVCFPPLPFRPGHRCGLLPPRPGPTPRVVRPLVFLGELGSRDLTQQASSCA